MHVDNPYDRAAADPLSKGWKQHTHKQQDEPRTFAEQHEPARMSRRNFLKAGAGAIAAGSVLLSARDSEAQQPGVPVKSQKRLALPAGYPLVFALDAGGFDANGYAHWGVNKKRGTADFSGAPNTEVIVTGAPGKTPTVEEVKGNAVFLGARTITPAMMIGPPAPGGQTAVMVGEYKVACSPEGGGIFLFNLKPNRSIQLSNMPNTTIISSKDGVVFGGVTNSGKTDVQVALVVPLSEMHNINIDPRMRALSVGGAAQSSDITYITQGISGFKAARTFEEKKAMHDKLEPLIKAVLDAAARDANVGFTDAQMQTNFETFKRTAISPNLKEGETPEVARRLFIAGLKRWFNEGRTEAVRQGKDRREFGLTDAEMAAFFGPNIMIPKTRKEQTLIPDDAKRVHSLLVDYLEDVEAPYQKIAAQQAPGRAP